MAKIVDAGYDLSYFMQKPEENREFEFEAPKRFKDKEGKPLMFKFRILSEEELREIRSHWHTRKYVQNEKGRYVFKPNGAIAYDEQVDTDSMIMEFLVESLIYPNLKDKELRKFHNTQNALEMPYKVFTRNEVDDLYYQFNVAHGYIVPEQENEEDSDDDNKEPSDIDKAKN